MYIRNIGVPQVMMHFSSCIYRAYSVMAVKSRNPEYSTFIGKLFKVKNPKALLCTYFMKAFNTFVLLTIFGLNICKEFGEY